LVGNAEDAAALEFTLAGPALEFVASHVVALAGAPIAAELDGEPAANGESFAVSAGARPRLGRIRAGARCVLGVRGGIAVSPVLGSRSTMVPAGFGGQAGRPLAKGDVLSVGAAGDAPRRRLAPGTLPELNPGETLR